MLMAKPPDSQISPQGAPPPRGGDAAPSLPRAGGPPPRLRPRPDVVLATGDLVDAGTAEEYRRLHGLLAPLPMPVYLIPGNHDNRDALAAAFADHAYLPRGGRFMQYVVEEYPVRLVALDTLVPGHVGGLLCDERLGWPAARLDEARQRPTVRFMHHPPFVTGIAPMDPCGPANASEFAAVGPRHPPAQRVGCGP